MTDVIRTALVTFAIVMAGMILLTGVCAGLRRFSTSRAGDVEDVAASGVPLEVMAVLAAAASEALRRPVRIRRIHVHRAPESERWSRAGRIDVMISHRVGPRR